MTRFILLAAAALALAPRHPGLAEDPSDSKPAVLILGDSISIGYTPIVRELLAGEARVVRPTNANGGAENCQGTEHGVTHIDRWLALPPGRWDVIHFNFGLHDLKRVDPETRRNSNNPSHLNQSPPTTYARQLEEIVERLKATGARLIFANTTPVPHGGVRPHRDAGDPIRYNLIAAGIMQRHDIPVNDLYGAVFPRLKELQQPVNVHFTPEGSTVLAEHVAEAIRRALSEPHRE